MVIRDHLKNCTNGTYNLVGEMLATSILQEGEPPSFLAPTIVAFMKNSVDPQYNLADVDVYLEDVPGGLGQALHNLVTCDEKDFPEVLGEQLQQMGRLVLLVSSCHNAL